MDSIIRIKLTPEDYITGFICRFCMLPCDQNEMLQIPWNEWQHSLLAAMYERIMQQEVSTHSKLQQETLRFEEFFSVVHFKRMLRILLQKVF